MSRVDKDKGAVLITTLLIMAIMATLAITILDQVRFGVKRAVNMESHTQAQWYLRGAQTYAHTYLKDQISRASDAQLNQILSQASPIIFPIEGGSIIFSVRDGSQCISLGDLSVAATQRDFSQLLQILGLSETEAARLTAVVLDWQDSDTRPRQGGAEDFTYLDRAPAYRTPNTSFHSVTELRALDGMSETLYQALRPFICVRAENLQSFINVNTLSLQQAPLLALRLGGHDRLETAISLIQDRPPQGYKTLSVFQASPLLQDIDLRDASLDKLDIRPHFIWVEAIVNYGTARQYGAFEFFLSEAGIEPVFKSYNHENFRPILSKEAL